MKNLILLSAILLVQILLTPKAFSVEPAPELSKGFSEKALLYNEFYQAERELRTLGPQLETFRNDYINGKEAYNNAFEYFNVALGLMVTSAATPKLKQKIISVLDDEDKRKKIYFNIGSRLSFPSNKLIYVNILDRDCVNIVLTAELEEAYLVTILTDREIFSGDHMIQLEHLTRDAKGAEVREVYINLNSDKDDFFPFQVRDYKNEGETVEEKFSCAFMVYYGETVKRNRELTARYHELNELLKLRTEEEVKEKMKF